MTAPSARRDNFRARGRKVTAPAFRVGIGQVYRELEKQGKIHEDAIEKKAEYEEAKAALAAKAKARANRKGLWGHIKAMGNWISSHLD